MPCLSEPDAGTRGGLTEAERFSDPGYVLAMREAGATLARVAAACGRSETVVQRLAQQARDAGLSGLTIT